MKLIFILAFTTLTLFAAPDVPTVSFGVGFPQGNQILTSGQAAGLVPVSDGLGGSTYQTAGTGTVSTAAAVGASPNANGLTITGANINLQPANASFPGVVTTGAQTLAGAKTFSSDVDVTTGVINKGGGKYIHAPLSNMFAGVGAGSASPTGDLNAGLGFNALNLLTTGANNSTFGAYTGRLLTTGSNNSFLGFGTGFSATTAFQNTYVGALAGVSATTSSNNVAVGYASANAATTAIDNTFVGASTGPLVTTGSSNTLVGFAAGLGLVTGARNVFVGANAGVLTTSSDNVFVGRSAGTNTSTGDSNTFVGKDSGLANTIGGNNAFIGKDAGGANTQGSGNSYFGWSAGSGNTTGNSNTVVGSEAGTASSSATGNTFLGNRAGKDTTGGSNTFLGERAGNNTTSGASNIIIGPAAVASSSTASNELVIGAAGAEFINGDASNLRLNRNTMIGGGITGTANYKLDLRGAGGDSTFQQTNTTSGNLSTDGIIYVFNGTDLTINNQENGAINLTTTGKVKKGNYVLSPCEEDDGNSGTADTLDLSVCAVHKSTLTGNVTYTLSTPVTGGSYLIRIATGAGGFTVTWPAAVKWSGGTAPVITATASKVDVVNLYYDGTDYYGTFSQNY